MERYREEMKRYTPSPEYIKLQQLAEAATAPAKKVRTADAATAAGAPRSAYRLFAQANMPRAVAELAGPHSQGDLELELARRWSRLGARDRLPYEKQAAEEGARHRKARLERIFFSYVKSVRNLLYVTYVCRVPHILYFKKSLA